MPRNRLQDNLKLARLQQHRLNSLPEAAPRVHLKAEQDGLAQSQERGDNPVLLQPGLFTLRLTQVGGDAPRPRPAWSTCAALTVSGICMPPKKSHHRRAATLAPGYQLHTPGSSP
jgi:hypothetical protein